ncbi:beta-glucosidase 13 [Physcomitrium patens]|uniref:Beta-glucosidase n=1 Tax=Physcomitrium patens TaxID=3218 RepID=A0A2K1L372_PHYPA|nr:beta-glucosidase 13-like [Physcomitrium patens]XP_024358585.1 beta-glucosidase 13-like [Physcomitrium patens]XP_024358586.1 beta-glucosidase 13-like [Physcomitrium patens]XP_024358587.1 beta-glucosidase 13-like [Physcomitrium patens]PNR60478.1 hypothetical protein PHYPA_003271 [Physcomitrium patens]|eukprot:XP_024358584.1 beta-glucosidase 13-like [Physcomitrella patens]
MDLIMVKIMLLIAVCTHLSLLTLVCGDKSTQDGAHDKDWTSKLMLNTSSELGGVMRRSLFPEGFVFGSSASAYQYEGAAAEDGRGPSIWDEFAKRPGTVKDNATGDIAVDQYHRFEEDVKIMKDIGLDAYRFSISWSRILPHGRGFINTAGVAYYNRLINELHRQSIVPFVTLHHFDLPLALEQTGGWRNADTASAFAEFAALCFSLFGDRVKYWITFNEIHILAMNGYRFGIGPPGRCSASSGDCFAGDSDVEPPLVVHNALNAHALAVSVYRMKFQSKQKGLIGLIEDGSWFEPCKDTDEDRDAALRANEYWLGWILDPLFFGEYPASMRAFDHRKTLPRFTKEQSALLKGSLDFLGLNQYTSQFATYDKHSVENNDVTSSPRCNGVPIGPQAAVGWIYVYPDGMRKQLDCIRTRYGNPVVYITENGFPTNANDEPWSSQEVQDFDRISYHHGYMQSLLSAIRGGSDVRGYFVWSLLDNFEWHEGFRIRFGLYQVDIGSTLNRQAKASARWFKLMLDRVGGGGGVDAKTAR